MSQEGLGGSKEIFPDGTLDAPYTYSSGFTACDASSRAPGCGTEVCVHLHSPFILPWLFSSAIALGSCRRLPEALGFAFPTLGPNHIEKAFPKCIMF